MNKTISKKIIAFCIGTIIFVLLPIIARSVQDIRWYLSNIERLLYIIIMVIANILVVIIIPNQGKGVGEGEKPMKRHRISLLALQIIPLLILIISPISDRHQIYILGEHEWIRTIGIAFVVIGFIIMNWSAYILDKQFSTDVTIQKEHTLITSGPYKSIRHPRYLGIIVFFLGVAWVFHTILWGLLVLVLSGFLLWRIYDEEKIMEKTFKKQWEIYTKKTWKLFPYIW